MIIKSLRATNFMKFHEIDIRDLPETGEIAVIGQNESGKTTLGECIAFALFGRTVRTEETDPAQVINWNADDCSTSIVIQIGGKGEYKIERQVNRSGLLAARIVGPDGELVAEDLNSASRVLHSILGFTFPEFRYSFYVAQKEIDIIRHSRNDNTRQIVFDMLGITSIERARANVDREINELSQSSETLDRDLAVARALKNSVEVDDETMSRFETEKVEIEDRIARAMSAEQSAKTEFENARARISAREDVLSAFERFQKSYLRSATRRKIESYTPGLVAAQKCAENVIADVNRELMKDEKSFQMSKEKVAKARRINILVKQLKSLVEARHSFLANELKESNADVPGWIPRTKAEYKVHSEMRISELQSALSGGLIGMIVFGLLGVAGAGVGGAIFAKAIAIQDGTLPLELKAAQAALFLVILGVVFLIVAIMSLLRRSKTSAELSRLEESLAALKTELVKMSEESAACAAFRDEPLSEIESQIRRIGNEEITAKFRELQNEGREFLESQGSIDSLLSGEVSKEDSIREARERLSPKLAQASRIKRLCDEVLARVTRVCGDISEVAGALPPAIDEAIKARDLNNLESPLDALTREASKAILTLESMSADDSVLSITDSSKLMKDALLRHFQLAENGQEQRSDFESRSALPKLLQSQHSLAQDEIRDHLSAEGKLLGELLGDSETLTALVKGAETRLLKTTEERVEAQNARVALFTRSENLRNQLERREELMVKIAGLENALDPISRQLAVRRELVKLFGETIQGMKARFGPNICRYIELLLPRMTSNRYRRVQISPDLDIKVYSSERADFVRLIDLSYGTSDQILLALRLGLAQALVHSRGMNTGRQFMFLDEPLSAFDEARGQAFLQIMKTFDDNFSQIFVSSAVGLDAPFDRVIELQTESHEVNFEG